MIVTDDLQVKINAFYNFPYYYNDFRTEINFKPILEEISLNENTNIQILRVLASSLPVLFEIADKNNAEEEFPLWRKIFENLLVKDDQTIL